ncbi:MAG: integrin alpha [Acidimicrobiales bacterium]
MTRSTIIGVLNDLSGPSGRADEATNTSEAALAGRWWRWSPSRRPRERAWLGSRRSSASFHLRAWRVSAPRWTDWPTSGWAFRFGPAVSTVWDVNGDGIADFAVGAPSATAACSSIGRYRRRPPVPGTDGAGPHVLGGREPLAAVSP